MSYQIGC